MQPAGLRSAIPFATKSQPDSQQDRHPWTGRNAFSTDRQCARLQGKQAPVYTSCAAISAAVVATKHSKLRSNALRGSRVLGDTSARRIQKVGTRICAAALGQLVATSRQ